MKKELPKGLPDDFDIQVLPGPGLRLSWGGKVIDFQLSTAKAKSLAVLLAGAVLERERTSAERAVLN